MDPVINEVTDSISIGIYFSYKLWLNFLFVCLFFLSHFAAYMWLFSCMDFPEVQITADF